MNLWLIHELAYETRSRCLFTCNSRGDKRASWSRDPSCIGVRLRLSGIERCVEREKDSDGKGWVLPEGRPMLLTLLSLDNEADQMDPK